MADSSETGTGGTYPPRTYADQTRHGRIRQPGVGTGHGQRWSGYPTKATLDRLMRVLKAPGESPSIVLGGGRSQLPWRVTDGMVSEVFCAQWDEA